MITLVDADLAADLQAVLDTALSAKRRECGLIDPAVGEAAGMVADFVLYGGKRLRPTFAWWGWRGVPGGKPRGELPGADEVLAAVAALELVHAGALLHDDVIDGSTTRRGRPTVHVRLAAAHREAGWHGDPDRFGHAGAILFGDLALAWAEDLLRDAGLPAAALRRVSPVWGALRTEVLGGQYLDVRAQAYGDLAGGEEGERSALQVALFKSASYTVARPLQFGGALGGADEELMAAYHRFGCDLGVAFQLRDDLLGVFGDPAETGKPAGDDLREGKRTLLVAFALSAAERSRAVEAGRAIRSALGRDDLSADELDLARTALVELGAVHAVEDRIADLTEAAMTTLDAAPIAPAAATRLAELAVAATVRRA